MKFTEVTIDEVKNYCRVDYDDDNILFTAILDGAKAHVRTYTGLKDDKLDTLPDTTIALLVISNEMYDNREGTRNDNKSVKFNEVLDRILGSHSINLL
ncbi:head-tail connector protein [Tissierella creatinophila]|uniref:Phage gp6-like head-tail connector protein n=1 Tax=Tissierella creatinophila DSM 6911 TaxID=1123403 RepID=A0A1U7M554_TISCR|nr:head-tail connector protein [Tissierella creatinophila]OLS02421.1 phage gp6-like head-tail connector protein [Tissierella creatinophila DSM 6911]